MLRLVVACAALGAAAGCGKADSNAARPNPSRCQRDYPTLTGRVVDGAELLSDAEERDMTARLSAIEQRTAHQVVIATVDNTNGKNIAEYSTCLGRQWGIGRAKIDDGVLIVIARDDQKARIAVGYGLEKALTDSEAQIILDGDMMPAFATAHYADGLNRGIAAIDTEIGAAR